MKCLKFDKIQYKSTKYQAPKEKIKANFNQISFCGAFDDNFSNSSNENRDNLTQKFSNFAKNLINIFTQAQKPNKTQTQEQRAKRIKKTVLKMKLKESDAEFAYNLAKNSPIPDKDIIYAAVKFDDEQKRKCLKTFQSGLKLVPMNTFLADNFDDEAIEIAAEIKKLPEFDDEYDVRIINNVLVGNCRKENIEILKKILNAGFFIDAAFEFANKMTQERLQKAIKLKEAFTNDFDTLETAAKDISEKQIQQLCDFKKAGIINDSQTIKRGLDGLNDEESQDLINLRQKLNPKYPTNIMLKIYDKGAKDKAELFEKLDKFFQIKNALELLHPEITQDEAQKLIINKITSILDGNADISLEEIKNYHCESSKKQAELIDEVIYFVEKFDMTVYDAIPALDSNLLRSEPLIRKKDILESLERALSKNLDEKDQEKLKQTLEKVKTSINQTITTQKISNKRRKELWSGFLANNEKIEEAIKQADFAKFKTQGLDLIYPRKDFIDDLNKILAPLSNKEKKNILNKLEIFLTEDKKGYDGIINLEKLDRKNETEKEIFEIADKFLNHNKIKLSGNKELDFALNSLINGMSEFINIIGKRQHFNQAYSVDIHILKVLQNVLLNPEYQKLSTLDKTCLKLTIILHDIAKTEGIVDKLHPEISAKYAEDILKEYNLPSAIKTRVVELIQNHHWFEKYNSSKSDEETVKMIAPMFRNKIDYMISKILTKADIEGIGNKLFLRFIDDLNDKEKQKPLVDEIDKINSSGQIFITSKIIFKDKIPQKTHNGKTYRVLDLTKLDDDADLERFGFEKGTRKDNFRLLVHTGNEKNLESVFDLEKATNCGLLSTSFISCDFKETFLMQNFGLSIETQNRNIANAARGDQISGRYKNYKDFAQFSTNAKNRNLIPDKIKEILDLSDEEYKKLYEIIAPKKYFSQIAKVENYKIANKTISSKDIINAVKIASDEIIQGQQNEILAYTPKINAFVAKVNDFEEIPQEFLEIAEKHDLPIFIIGKSKSILSVTNFEI